MSSAFEAGVVDGMEKTALSVGKKVKALQEASRRLKGLEHALDSPGLSHAARQEAESAISSLKRKIPAFSGVSKTNYGMRKDIDSLANERLAKGVSAPTRIRPAARPADEGTLGLGGSPQVTKVVPAPAAAVDGTKVVPAPTPVAVAAPPPKQKASRPLVNMVAGGAAMGIGGGVVNGIMQPAPQPGGSPSAPGAWR